MRRLCQGCDRLGIHRPDTGLLRDEAIQEAGKMPKGVLKILITRGPGGRGYSPPASQQPCRALHTFPWPPYPADRVRRGVDVRVCDFRLGRNSRLAGIKHLGRLEQVLARSEWNEPAIAEGLMLDTEGRVIEGTMTNLFLRKGDRLYTPDVSDCGTAGIVRELVMDMAGESGLTLSVTDLYPEDVFAADGAFLTNSVIGFWPVRKLEHRELEVPPVPPAFSESLMSKVYSP